MQAVFFTLSCVLFLHELLHSWFKCTMIMFCYMYIRPLYRAFSWHVMLSSNMVASIATKINIHLCKHLFTVLCIAVSQWTYPFVVQAHGAHECPGYPGQSAESDGHVGGPSWCQWKCSISGIKVYLYQKSIFWCVKGTQFRSPLHQNSEKKVHLEMK